MNTTCFYGEINHPLFTLELILCYEPYDIPPAKPAQSDQSSLSTLTLVLLNPDIPCLANSVDPDQLASEEPN